MTYGQIKIIDKSKASGYDATSASALVHALTRQAASAGRAYHVSAQFIVWAGSDAAVLPDAWPIVILDDPDTAGALGYHDLDPQGKPYGRVFVTPTKDAGVALSSVISHEVIEAVVDPYANLWADANHGVSYAFEACDPVENDTYSLSGVEVSNFVTRAWFDASATPASGPFDHMRQLTAPFTMSPGGYLIRMADGKISNIFGDEYPQWRKELKAAPQPSRTTWRSVRLLAEAAGPE